MSWPDGNPLFGRRWAMPPPLKRERRPPAGTALLKNSIGNANAVITTVSDRSAQRAVALAMRQADRLAARAVVLAAVGQGEAALRLADLAARLPEVTQ